MKPLSYREIQVLQQLAQGSTYKEIQDYFGMSPANVHVHCHHIRQKTGIRQTRDQKECQRALRQLDQQRVTDALKPATLNSTKAATPAQLEIFRLLAHGRTYAQIALSCGILPQSVQNIASQGCKRVGIRHQGWNRTQAIQAWLRAHEGGHTEPDSSQTDPMDDPAF